MLVLELPATPVLRTSLQTPDFIITYSGRVSEKCPSEYLLNKVWVDALKATVKDVGFGVVNDGMVDKAK